MSKNKFLSIFILLYLIFQTPLAVEAQDDYTIGINDVLEISILQPDEFIRVVTVSPDGTITYPYIGSIVVKDLRLSEVQEIIQKKLSEGYMKYPIVLVSLQESRSREYFVYGEVNRAGAYPLGENSTVLKAISMAGGFTKFGSSSRVKVLRSNKDKPGYQTIKVKIKEVMNGKSEEDIILQQGDMVIVSEGVF